MRAMCVAAVSTVLIATVPISAAADQIITESFNVTIPSTVVPDADDDRALFDSTLFPLFAPTSGTLNSVSIAVSGAVIIASLIANPEVDIGLEGSSQVDVVRDVKSGTTNIDLSGPDTISSYIGSGNGQVRLAIISGDPTPNASLIASDGPLSGLVTYTYSLPTSLPTLAVPETPTWATMLIGFASLGLAAYRAARKTSVSV
jgi:hypothetical protein